MAASINLKKGKLVGDFLKRTAGLITGAAGDYIQDAMPTTTSTLSEASSAISETMSTLSKTSQSVMPSVKSMKNQVGLRNIFKWYMTAGDMFSDSSIYDDSSLSFDIDVDYTSAEISKIEIGEAEANANKISKSVIDSSQQLLEGQMHLTANIVTSIDQQSAIISKGFDNTHSILNKILEVVTKNTAAIITTNVAAAKKENHNDDMLSRGRFNLSDYKKIFKENLQKSPELGMISAMLPMMSSMTGMAKTVMTPQTMVSMLFGYGMNKFSPNLKKNMKALDDAVNETIMNSLIRLGESNDFGGKGTLSRLFGIDSSRKEFSGSRSSLELKTVPFDSIAHESITNAIPGYLRKILMAISGEDAIYDYRSRTFRTKTQIKREFNQTATNTGSLGRASDQVRKSFGTDSFGNMIYDLMMTDLGSKTYGGQARSKLDSFKNPENFLSYIESLYSENMIKATEAERNRLKQMADNIAASYNTNIGRDISNQISMSNINRSKRIEKYLDEAGKFNMDLSDLKTSVKEEIKNTFETYGRASSYSVSSASADTGSSYTNKALYEIYRVLNRGINVFKVGGKDMKKSPYSNKRGNYLNAPANYKPRQEVSEYDSSMSSPGSISSVTGMDYQNEVNLLENQQLEDGSMENLTKGQRFSRWSKSRGHNLGRALFSGSPEEVRAAFGLIVKDLTSIAGNQAKIGAERINQQFGNVSGYLKHKIFGTGYKYQDTDENGKPITVEVADNEKGGYFGFVKDYVADMFKGTTEKAKGWFNQVAGYFDYGDKDESSDVKRKRKRFLSTSVGAFAGAGLLGGPIGLIMGAVAGNALSGLDIGSKFKEMMFGRDKKGKAKGLVVRALDGVVDPLKYQIGKSILHFSGNLKKNVFGPLSDIGIAIKDRITSAASSHFGKVFKFIGKTIMAPFKAFTGFAKLPITLMGNLFRLRTGVTGAVVGTGLNAVASGIAGKSTRTVVDPETGETKTISTREYLKQRRAERAKIVKGERKYEVDPNTGEILRDENGNAIANKYSSWKVFKDAENKRRADWSSKLSDYTSERVMSAEEIKARDAQIKSAEDTAEIKEGVNLLAELGSEKGSIYTHDEGLHERLDTIISHLTGYTPAAGATAPRKPGEVFNPNIDNDFANTAASIAATLASEGEITKSDQRLAMQIFSEAAKPNSNKSVVHSATNKLLQSQQEASQVRTEEKKSFWEKLLETISGDNGILGTLLKWGTVLGSILAAINLFGGGGANVAKNLFENTKDAVQTFAEAGTSKDPTTNGVNAVLNFVDTKVKSLWDIPNPFGDIQHNDSVAGNDIKHQTATDAKNDFLYFIPIKQYLMKSAVKAAQAAGLYKKSDMAFADASGLRQKSSIASLDEAKSLKEQSRASANKSGDYYKKAEELDAQAKDMREHTASNAIKDVAKNYARGAVLSLTSKLVGGVASNAAKLFGVDEEIADRVGNYATAGAASYLTLDHIKKAAKGKDSKIDKILEVLKKLFNFLADKFKTVDKFRSFANKIGPFFDNIYNKSVGKVTSAVANKIEAALATKLGASTAKQAVGAAGVGIPIAIGAISGLASGLCSVEHLFQVLPERADGTMAFIAATMKAVFEALEWTPAVGFIVAALNVIDSFIILGVFGKSLQQYIAEFLYNLLKQDGGAELSMRQGDFNAQRELYNQKYGTELNAATFNDHINNGNWWDLVWRGKNKIDELGNLTFDKAGGRIDNGLKNIAVGGERDYVKDVSTGRYMQAKDALGNELKVDSKWGDDIGRGWTGLKHWFLGGDVYATNAEGKAIVKDGNYVVDKTDKNVFGRAWDGITGFFGVNHDNGVSYRPSSISSGSYGGSSYAPGLQAKEEEKIKSSQKKLESSVDKMKKSAEAGNIAAISDSIEKFDNDTDNTNFFIAKLTNYALGSAKWLGSKISKGLNFASNIVSNYHKLDQATSKIADSSVDSIWNDNITFDSSDPLSPYMEASYTLAKLYHSAFALFSSTGEAISATSNNTKSNRSNANNKSWFSNIMGSLGFNVGGPDEGMCSCGHRHELPMGGPDLENPIEGGNPLTKDYTITSPYGPRKFPRGKMHHGIDLVPKDGSNKANVISTFSGTVSHVTRDRPDSDTAKKVNGRWNYFGKHAAGNQVWVDADNGMRIKSMHFKAGSIPANIKPGARVRAGQILGAMGSTGWSTGPHLHYQMEKDTVSGHDGSINPLGFVENGVTHKPVNMFAPAEMDPNFNPTPEKKGFLSGLTSVLTDLGQGFLGLITGNVVHNNTKRGAEISESNFTTPIIGGNEDEEALWRYFKSLGYSDKVIAGVLGSWSAESGNRPKRVEGDYLGIFNNMLGYDKMYERDLVDAYTLELFNAYAKEDFPINKKGYYADDGHLYPGIGFAQWTGPRAKALLEFAKRKNLDWTKASTQLMYLDTELKGSYSHVPGKMEDTYSPEESAAKFTRLFEGFVGDSTPRQQAARRIFEKYSSLRIGGPDYDSKMRKEPDVFDMPMGGPDESVITTKTNYVTPSTVIPKFKKLTQYNQSSKSFFNTQNIPKVGTTKSDSNHVCPDLSAITSLILKAIEELSKIANNTFNSNTLLDSINEKEFVDHQLRNTISTLGKTKPKSFKSVGSSSSSARAATSLARP